MITVQNYNQQKQSIDWAKLPKEVAALKDDVDFSIEFYNDDDGIKETIDLFLKAVNKASASEPKKPTIKEITKASSNIHIVTPSHGKIEAIKDASNLVILVVKNREGEVLEVLSSKHDGTKDNMKKINSELREKADMLFSRDFNNVNSQTGVTNKKGKPVFVVSPNSKNIANANTKEADYILGNWDIDTIIEFKETKVPRKSTRTLISSLPFVKLFMPDHQQKMLMQQNSEELDGVLQDLEASLKAIPTKEQGENIMKSTVYAHYFYGGSDWYILDYSKSKQLFFGYVVLNGDTQMSEAGYISPAELKETGKVELDFYFTPKKLADILVKKYPGEFPNLENPPKKAENPPKKTQKPPIEKKVDTKQVDRFSKEFMLIRRFFNLVKKQTVSFRSIQLLYMAFNKAAVGRDVRKTSEDAELFTEVNKKMTALFKISDVKKITTEIDFTDKALLSKIENYATSRKLNYAITLLKSFISMQGTKPDVKKAQNLLNRIESAISKNLVDKDNRLWLDIQEAKKELKAYIEKPTVKIEPEVYGLSFPKRSVCTNRIKCEGLRHDGKLKKGYKFNKKAEVIKTPFKKKGKLPLKKTPQKIKHLGTVLIDATPPTTQPVVINEGITTVAPLEITEPIQEHQPPHDPKPITKPKNGLVQGLQEAKTAASNVQLFKLQGELAKFLGNLEKKAVHSLVITLDAPPGSGKTRALFQMINMVANAGLTTVFFSLEEHPQSKLFADKATMYIEPKNERLIDVVGDLPETYEEFIKIVKQYDFIGVDSWNKAFEKYKVDFDNDLRKRVNGKLIATIFQRTTTGTMRGGAKAGFDGDIILEVVKDTDFRNSYLQARKNRYQNIPLNEIGYNFYSQKVINPEQQNAFPREMTV